MSKEKTKYFISYTCFQKGMKSPVFGSIEIHKRNPIRNYADIRKIARGLENQGQLDEDSITITSFQRFEDG